MHIFQRSTLVFLLSMHDDIPNEFESVAQWMVDNNIYALLTPTSSKSIVYYNNRTTSSDQLVELIFKRQLDAVLFKMQWCDEN